VFINRRKKEIHLKIVYYGPALSGKTTNLQYVHGHTREEMRGDLVSLTTKEDRTIFFDYMTLDLGAIAGLKPRFNLYTVPGQVYYASTRKLVLQGADGLVFVADSAPDRVVANRESLKDLGRYLQELGYDLRNTPLVVQFNKRDLANALPIPKLREYLRLTNPAIPVTESIAIRGDGVFDTLKTTINLVLMQVREKLQGQTKSAKTI
jgi:hypothetical protein